EVRLGFPDLDDPHVELLFHPIVGLDLGANSVSSDVNVVIQVFQLRFPFEFRRGYVNLIAHILEEFDSDSSFAPARFGGEVRDDGGVLVRQMFKNNAQIGCVKQVLQIRPARRRQEIDQTLGGNVLVDLQELDGGP